MPPFSRPQRRFQAYVSSWRLWRQPRQVVGYVLGLDLAALALLAASPLIGSAHRADLVTLAGLLVVAVLCIEVGRDIEHRREIRSADAPYGGLAAVWIFAGLLVLPPLLAAVLTVVTLAHIWLRARPGVAPYQRVFWAATVVAASATAAAILSATVGYPGLPANGPSALLGVLSAAVAYWLVHYALAVGRVLLATPAEPARTALGDPADQLVLAGGLGLAIGLAALVAFRPWLTVLLVVAVLAVHRGLLTQQLQTAANRDAKTGLANSEHWFTVARTELDRARRVNRPLGILVLDLDHFKRINDQHGHLAGDDVIKAVATALAAEVRGYDLVGRFGGEEFVVLLPEIEHTGELVRIAERIRGAVERLSVTVDGTRVTTGSVVVDGLSTSIGATISTRHGDTLEELVLAADTACYAAKDAGRNRVHVASGPPPNPAGCAATGVAPRGAISTGCRAADEAATGL